MVTLIEEKGAEEPWPVLMVRVPFVMFVSVNFRQTSICVVLNDSMGRDCVPVSDELNVTLSKPLKLFP